MNLYESVEHYNYQNDIVTNNINQRLLYQSDVQGTYGEIVRTNLLTFGQTLLCEMILIYYLALGWLCYKSAWWLVEKFDSIKLDENQNLGNVKNQVENMEIEEIDGMKKRKLEDYAGVNEEKRDSVFVSLK